MNKLFFLITIVLVSCFACGNQVDPNASTFGDSITKEGTITYEQLLNKLSDTDSMNTKVVGTVSEVCQAKGCWMTIVSDNSDEVMRVQFKDYAFFVPKDISGRKVVFQGKAYKESTSVDELRHYAEDAGKSEEEIAAITEPQDSYKFMASGVLLLD